jgi:hypothetical protein
MKEQYNMSQHHIEFAAKISSEFAKEFSCVNFMSQSIAVQDIASNIYKRYNIPAIISHNATETDCPNYFMIVSNTTEALLRVRQLHLGTQNKIILFSFDEECPSTDIRIFVAGKVILACSVTKAIYRLGVLGEFFALPIHSRLLQDETSSPPNYMGRLLRVSSFSCPPYSDISKGKQPIQH